jgi:anthranilate synthase/aminodeoxychorismate synthase-like glutamine amidotransferase
VRSRVLLIDNYDSFTFNLVQGFRMLDAVVDVYRNDEITVLDAVAMHVSHVVISPGPGCPDDAGVSMDMIRACAGRWPVLGVCLGHQCLVAAYGGNIVRAPQLMHGKTSMVRHDGIGLFHGLPQPFQAGRYHSLTATADDLPDGFTITAQTDDNEIMGIRHKALGLEGLQFHPESVLTPEGQTMLEHFLSMRLHDNGEEPAHERGT